jgi:hypothetical protein
VYAIDKYRPPKKKRKPKVKPRNDQGNFLSIDVNLSINVCFVSISKSQEYLWEGAHG